MISKCELCDSPAKMYCESDQASLCWDCDNKVHGANFLVAKHVRTLLCHVCQSLTPWNGSGPKLGPTVSVCNVCVGNSSRCREERKNEQTHSDEEDDDIEEEEDDDEDNDEDEDEDDDGNSDEDDEENQVVPWSSTPPPPVSSSSTSDQEYSSKFCNGPEDISESQIAFSVKRMRETTKFHSQQDRIHRGYSSSHQRKNSYL
ncbi:Zinc finger, B-box [Melia azedarach]|uniref:Zinc finger, B-box n=1 Tax=Melia azedarach TaxID=155640 RepID=A0ACC1WY00_MELAZ|nr:Zinc finger, B-box [Melia azedarach]